MLWNLWGSASGPSDDVRAGHAVVFPHFAMARNVLSKVFAFEHESSTGAFLQTLDLNSALRPLLSDTLAGPLWLRLALLLMLSSCQDALDSADARCDLARLWLGQAF